MKLKINDYDDVIKMKILLMSYVANCRELSQLQHIKI